MSNSIDQPKASPVTLTDDQNTKFELKLTRVIESHRKRCNRKGLSASPLIAKALAKWGLNGPPRQVTVEDRPDDTAFQRALHVHVTRVSSESSIVDAVTALRRSVKRHFMCETRRRLFDLVGSLAERLRATSSYLFAARANGRLDSVITRGVRTDRGGTEIHLSVWDNGIVPHVARTRQAYCVGDVADCSFYRPTVRSTRSEVAIPILDPGNTSRFLGVLNLESDHPNKFAADNLSAISADINNIALHLKCLLRMDEDNAWAWPWNPKIGRSWTLRNSLARICTRIAEAVSKDHCASCTIWDVDWRASRLFVEATHGYDYEFIAAKTLALNSFTGDAARLGPEQVLMDDPMTRPKFLEKERARDFGLERVSSVPLFGITSVTPSAVDSQATGTLNVYAFRESRAPHLPRPEELVQLARFLGGTRAEFEAFRKDLALARLHGKLAISDDAGRFDAVRDVLCEVLDADSCTVFVCPPDGEEIIYVSTTGLVPETAVLRNQLDIQRIGNFESVKLRRSDQTGLVPYLARHVGCVLRLYDLANRKDRDCPADLPRVDRRFVDSIARNDEHCRFMGISVGLEGVSTGVIRVLRSSSNPPFSRADEELLVLLARSIESLFQEAAGSGIDTDVPTVVKLETVQ